MGGQRCPGRRRHVTAEAETGTMHLQAKEQWPYSATALGDQSVSETSGSRFGRSSSPRSSRQQGAESELGTPGGTIYTPAFPRWHPGTKAECGKMEFSFPCYAGLPGTG